MGDLRLLLFTHLDAMWRRRWFAAVIAWLVCVAGWIGVLMLPNQYLSEARIYVDTDSLGPLLKGIAITGDTGERLSVMKRTLLSRPNLEEVARMTDLDVTATTPETMENLYKRIELHTKITGRGRQNLFTVSHTHKDPVVARAVVQALLTIFVENNLGEDRNEMEAARSFIEDQIAIYEGQLRAAEGRLAVFQQENSQILAGRKGFAVRLEESRTNLAQIRLTYDDTMARRNELKNQLDKVPQMLKIDSTAPLILPGGPGNTTEVLLGRIQELQRNLDLLLLRYTEKHPDVIATKRTLGRLIAQYEQETSGATPRPTVVLPKAIVPNPLYDEVKLKLVDAEAEVITLRRRLAQTEAGVAKLESLTQTAPQVEARLTDLNRDYNVIQGKYEDLLNRREAARLAEAVEIKNDDIQFRIIDPPQVPTKPAAPNRKLFMLVVLIAGIAAGGGAVFLLSQLDETFSAPEDLKQAFGLPVLGYVSTLVDRKNKTRRVAGIIGFAAACLALVGIYGVLMALLPQLDDLPRLMSTLPLPEFVRGFI